MPILGLASAIAICNFAYIRAIPTHISQYWTFYDGDTRYILYNGL